MKTVQLRVTEIFQMLGLRGAAFIAGDPVVVGSQKMRRVDYVEFLLVTSGQGTRARESPSGAVVRSPLTPGLLLLFRTVDEPLLEGSGPDGVSLLVVSVPSPSWAAFADFVGIDPALRDFADAPSTLLDAADPRVREPFELALRRFRERPPTRMDLAEFLTAVVPLILPERSRDRAAALAPPWLLAGLEAMGDESNLRRGVGRLAELAHVSPQHLASTTRRYFAATPTRLVTELRLRHAAVLLSTTNESVGAIGRRCGYATLAHFSTTFTRAYGMSPREHRDRSA